MPTAFRMADRLGCKRLINVLRMNTRLTDLIPFTTLTYFSSAGSNFSSLGGVKLGSGYKRLINRKHVDENHIHVTSELLDVSWKSPSWKSPPHSLLRLPPGGPPHGLLVDFCASVNIY
jgi:hypothetical protein